MASFPQQEPWVSCFLDIFNFQELFFYFQIQISEEICDALSIMRNLALIFQDYQLKSVLILSVVSHFCSVWDNSSCSDVFPSGWIKGLFSSFWLRLCFIFYVKGKPDDLKSLIVRHATQLGWLLIKALKTPETRCTPLFGLNGFGSLNGIWFLGSLVVNMVYD